jgi:hypothetical protein
MPVFIEPAGQVGAEGFIGGLVNERAWFDGNGNSSVAVVACSSHSDVFKGNSEGCFARGAFEGNDASRLKIVPNLKHSGGGFEVNCVSRLNMLPNVKHTRGVGNETEQDDSFENDSQHYCRRTEAVLEIIDDVKAHERYSGRCRSEVLQGCREKSRGGCDER